VARSRNNEIPLDVHAQRSVRVTCVTTVSPTKHLFGLHRHQWVRMRTRVQNALQAIVLAHGVRRGHRLWNRDGQAQLASLPLPPHTTNGCSTWPRSVLERRCS
jgi:hypothetical protein